MLVLQTEALECTQMRGERRFFEFWRPQTPRQGSRLRSFVAVGCEGHNLSPSRKVYNPLKILDLATGPAERVISIRLGILVADYISGVLKFHFRYQTQFANGDVLARKFNFNNNDD